VLIVLCDAAACGSQCVALSLSAESATNRSVYVATLKSAGGWNLPMPQKSYVTSFSKLGRAPGLSCRCCSSRAAWAPGRPRAIVPDYNLAVGRTSRAAARCDGGSAVQAQAGTPDASRGAAPGFDLSVVAAQYLNLVERVHGGGNRE
jgi:hypothetical protein